MVAQPGQTIIAEETEGSNEEASIETNDDNSFVDLREELVVTDETEPITIECHAKLTKQSSGNTEESTNSGKQSDNRMSSPNDTQQSYNGTEPPEPVVFRIRTVESDFTGRQRELKELKDFFQQLEPPTPRICVVAGVDGMGKTQLVSKFIVENRSSYQNIIWIDAESSQSINDSFKKFAKQINATDGEGDTKSVVLNRFCESNTLFVYDNVVTIDKIKFALNGTVGGPRVLITSLAENWKSSGNIKVIRLEKWDHEEAVAFVSKKLNDPEDENADIEKLVEKLKCVPLALRLATAYIMWQRAIPDSVCFKISDYLDAIKLQGPADDYEKAIFVTSSIAYQAIHKTQTRGILAEEILNIIAYLAPNDIETKFFVHLTSLEDNSKIDKAARVVAACRLLANYGIVTFDKEDTQHHLNIHRSIQEILKSKLLQDADKERLLDQALKLISDLGAAVETIETVVPHAVYVFQSAKEYPGLVNKWSMLPAFILLKLLKEYPYHITSPSSQQLRDCIQRNEYLQKQLDNLSEKDLAERDTVTILAVLALQYLSNKVDSNFWMSWKFGVPLAVTGGVVAVVVGTAAVKQFVEQTTEKAVTKVINKAAQATEAAVSKAINETNQKWIVGAATTATVALIGALTGINVS